MTVSPQKRGETVADFILSQLLQPLPELLHRDAAGVAFLFLLSGLLAPCVEPTVADAARLDPREAPLVLPPIRLEYRVIGLFQRPPLERADLPAFLLSLRHRPLAVFRADAPRLGKVAPTVLAPPHGDVLLHTALQGEADHIPHRMGIQHRRTSIAIHRLKPCGEHTEWE